MGEGLAQAVVGASVRGLPRQDDRSDRLDIHRVTAGCHDDDLFVAARAAEDPRPMCPASLRVVISRVRVHPFGLRDSLVTVEVHKLDGLIVEPGRPRLKQSPDGVDGSWRPLAAFMEGHE